MKVINQDDRLALNCTLNDPERKLSVISSLKNIKLCANTEFSMKRLKLLIHQNSCGLPTRSGRCRRFGSCSLHWSCQHQQLEQISISSPDPSNEARNIPPLSSDKIILPYSTCLSAIESEHQAQGKDFITPFSPTSNSFLGERELQEEYVIVLEMSLFGIYLMMISAMSQFIKLKINRLLLLIL